MNIYLLSTKECTPSTWKGGVTYEYMIYPPTANYTKRDFLFRISSATIELEPSEFTRFKGCHRYLVMLDNPLKIQINKQEKTYEKHTIMEFDSNDEVTSYTKGHDFNWMVSEKVSHHKLKIAKNNQKSCAEIIFLFGLSPTVIKLNDDAYFLKIHDLLVIKNHKKENIEFQLSNKCLFGTLDF